MILRSLLRLRTLWLWSLLSGGRRVLLYFRTLGRSRVILRTLLRLRMLHRGLRPLLRLRVRFLSRRRSCVVLRTLYRLRMLLRPLLYRRSRMLLRLRAGAVQLRSRLLLRTSTAGGHRMHFLPLLVCLLPLHEAGIRRAPYRRLRRGRMEWRCQRTIQRRILWSPAVHVKELGAILARLMCMLCLRGKRRQVTLA